MAVRARQWRVRSVTGITEASCAQTAGGMLNQGWQTATPQDAMGNVRQQTSKPTWRMLDCKIRSIWRTLRWPAVMSQAQLQNATQRDIANAQIGGNLAGQQMTQANQVAMADADRFLRALATQQTMDTANLQGHARYRPAACPVWWPGANDGAERTELLLGGPGQSTEAAVDRREPRSHDEHTNWPPLAPAPSSRTSISAQILLGTLGVLARPGSRELPALVGSRKSL